MYSIISRYFRFTTLFLFQIFRSWHRAETTILSKSNYFILLSYSIAPCRINNTHFWALAEPCFIYSIKQVLVAVKRFQSAGKIKLKQYAFSIIFTCDKTVYRKCYINMRTRTYIVRYYPRKNLKIEQNLCILAEFLRIILFVVCYLKNCEEL